MGVHLGGAQPSQGRTDIIELSLRNLHRDELLRPSMYDRHRLKASSMLPDLTSAWCDNRNVLMEEVAVAAVM